MCPKGRGSGLTPPRVTELLTEAVAKSSQAAVAREAGITRLNLQRYLKGIGEPTTATLQKLADYFGVSVAYLRGEKNLIRMIVGKDEARYFSKLSDDLIELYDTVPSKYKASLWSAMTLVQLEIETLLVMHVSAVEIENEKTLKEALNRLNYALYKGRDGKYRATDMDEEGQVLFAANNPHSYNE